MMLKIICLVAKCSRQRFGVFFQTLRHRPWKISQSSACKRLMMRSPDRCCCVAHTIPELFQSVSQVSQSISMAALMTSQHKKRSIFLSSSFDFLLFTSRKFSFCEKKTIPVKMEWWKLSFGRQTFSLFLSFFLFSFFWSAGLLEPEKISTFPENACNFFSYRWENL